MIEDNYFDKHYDKKKLQDVVVDEAAVVFDIDSLDDLILYCHYCTRTSAA